jgi:hypothetical protein
MPAVVQLGRTWLGAALFLATVHCSTAESAGPPADAAAHGPDASGGPADDAAVLDGADGGAVPRIDELAWYAQLKAQRPDLVADVTPLGPC